MMYFSTDELNMSPLTHLSIQLDVFGTKVIVMLPLVFDMYRMFESRILNYFTQERSMIRWKIPIGEITSSEPTMFFYIELGKARGAKPDNRFEEYEILYHGYGLPHRQHSLLVDKSGEVVPDILIHRRFNTLVSAKAFMVEKGCVSWTPYHCNGQMLCLWFPHNNSTLTFPDKGSKRALYFWKRRYEKLVIESGLSSNQ